MAEPIVILSIPQLRACDVTPGALASLEELSRQGELAELVPAFPGTAASSFATLMTGEPPSVHGIVGDTYYDRQTGRIAARPLPDSAVTAPKLWERLREQRPGARTLLWFAPNSRGAAVDLAAWTGPDACLETQPAGLADDLTRRFGPLPCPSGTGEPPRREVAAWTLRTAAAVIAVERPDLAVVRLAYLGQVARRFGPDGREAGRALRALEAELRPFLAGLPAGTLLLAVTESVTTPVCGPVFPNRTLRELGLLRLATAPGGGTAIDPAGSAAFALPDHQICHIYLNDPRHAAPLASAFAGDHADGIAQVAALGARAALGMDHPRSGDIVLVARPDRWFAADWWTDPADRPATADPSPLGGGPIDPARVLGSLGAPVPGPEYFGVLVASAPGRIARPAPLAARDLAAIVAGRRPVGRVGP
jgi:hypothetical protein